MKDKAIVARLKAARYPHHAKVCSVILAALNDVLAAMAQGTGGVFFHDDNDLKAGFDALVGHPENYTLAFAPREMKLDGKFHELKVTFADKRKGYTILGRRGYFAVAPEADTAPRMDAKNETSNRPGFAPAHTDFTAASDAGPIAPSKILLCFDWQRCGNLSAPSWLSRRNCHRSTRVDFREYHLFRSESRIITDEEAGPADNAPHATSPQGPNF